MVAKLKYLLYFFFTKNKTVYFPDGVCSEELNKKYTYISPLDNFVPGRVLATVWVGMSLVDTVANSQSNVRIHSCHAIVLHQLCLKAQHFDIKRIITVYFVNLLVNFSISNFFYHSLHFHTNLLKRKCWIKWSIRNHNKIKHVRKTESFEVRILH